MSRQTVIIFQDSDYRGRVYRHFYPQRNRQGKGWIVEGKCDPDIGEHTYGGCVVMTTARPAIGKGEYRRARKTTGFRLFGEACRVADALNALADAPMLPPCPNQRELEISI